jgi:hypothetical protein
VPCLHAVQCLYVLPCLCMQELLLEGAVRHMESLDCMRFLPGSRLATKSRDGRMCIWDLATRQQLCAWKVWRSFACAAEHNEGSPAGCSGCVCLMLRRVSHRTAQDSQRAAAAVHAS